MMDVTYSYTESSRLSKNKTGKSNLFLSHYNESYQEKEHPCFFWGELKQPYYFARSLLNLSRIVSANFMPIPSSMRDPVITAGGGKLRLEAFSSCCSVYGKVDVLPKALDGEFLEQGTTNVDFNAEMITALSQVKKADQVFFSIGKKEFVMQKGEQENVEKKVSLPIRWIKGMTTVQVLSGAMKPVFEFDRLQMQLLFRSIPKGKVKADYYLSLRGKKPVLSPIKKTNSICIGGIHRLRLADHMLTLASGLKVYAMEGDNAIAFALKHPEQAIDASIDFQKGGNWWEPQTHLSWKVGRRYDPHYSWPTLKIESGFELVHEQSDALIRPSFFGEHLVHSNHRTADIAHWFQRDLFLNEFLLMNC